MIKPAKYKESSDNVKRMQKLLMDLNSWSDPTIDKPTGYFGDTTKVSLINFQKSYMKLSDKDLYDKKGNYVGCGPKTAEALNNLNKATINLYETLNSSQVPGDVKTRIKNGIPLKYTQGAGNPVIMISGTPKAGKNFSTSVSCAGAKSLRKGKLRPKTN